MADQNPTDSNFADKNDEPVVLPGTENKDSDAIYEKDSGIHFVASPERIKRSHEAGDVETLTPITENSEVNVRKGHVSLLHSVSCGNSDSFQTSRKYDSYEEHKPESGKTKSDFYKHTRPDKRKADSSETSSNDTKPEPEAEGETQKSHEAETTQDQAENFSSIKNVSLFEYFFTELTRGYQLEHEEAKFTEKRQKVYTFMKIPRDLEKFMTYGFFQCLDAFLYVFTFLPLRFVVALLKLCLRGCVATFIGINGRVLEPAQLCDLLKGIILIASCVMMNYIDVSMMYHIVRGQAIIKLYIFFNMLEVADRLFSSFGQDILDSLFWTATEPRGRKREHIGVIPHLLLAILYVSLHALLVLFQATTLNVAFNSHNKALLTIMMSNNFVELKGSVFKKFEKHNLFQMSCSDVRERFHFVILLAIVCMRNLTEFSWNMEHLWVLFPDVLMVMISEVMVDWVKHAFITKFNELPSEVYRDYTVSIAYDMAQSRQRNAFSDLLDVVSRRMGFIPLPLAVLLVRVTSQSLSITGWFDIILAALVFCCLITFKVFNSIMLLGLACGHIQESKDRKQQEEDEKKFHEINSPTGHKRSKSLVENLSTIEKPNLSRKIEDDFPMTPTFLTQTSLNSKVYLSNSTVSLSSVTLNEDFVLDAKKTSSEGTELKHRGKEKEKRPSPPLNEIDRYTMCSNRII